MKCQIISDVHCDFGENWMYMRTVPVLADTLIVAGDLLPFKHLKWKKMCDQVLSRWQRVIHVPGNHDFYGMSASLNLDEIKYSNTKDIWTYKDKSTEYYRVNNCLLEIDGINFLCSTLWSKIDMYAHEIMRGVSDYKYIYGYNIKINNEMNLKSLEFLESFLIKDDGKKYVVITHHVPLQYFSHVEFQGSRLNEAFVNNLGYMVDKYSSKIKTWIFGHTHTFYHEKVMDVDFICNPLGYYELKEKTGFREDMVVEL